MKIKGGLSSITYQPKQQVEKKIPFFESTIKHIIKNSSSTGYDLYNIGTIFYGDEEDNRENILDFPIAFPLIQKIKSYPNIGDKILIYNSNNNDNFYFPKTYIGIISNFMDFNNDDVIIENYKNSIKIDNSSISISQKQNYTEDQTNDSYILFSQNTPIDYKYKSDMINWQKSSNSQATINSPKITINSIKDDILINSKTDTTITSSQSITIQSGEEKKLTGININEGKIKIGVTQQNQPTQPLILGHNLQLLISNLLTALSNFSQSLSATISTPEGTPIINITSAAQELQLNIKNIYNDINKLTSNNILISE